MTKKQKKSSRIRVQSKRAMKSYFNSVKTMHLANKNQAVPVKTKGAIHSSPVKKASGRGN